MSYEVIFDARQIGFGWLLFAVVGGAFLVVGWIWLISNRRHPNPTRAVVNRVFPYLFVTLSTLWVLATLGSMLYSYLELTHRLNTGRYEVVEGIVSQFDPMPYEGHRNESFIVNRHFYEYSDYAYSPGFNNTQSHGGPIREGLRVRIADVDGTIARLEIAR